MGQPLGPTIQARRLALDLSRDQLDERLSGHGWQIHASGVGKLERGERDVKVSEAATLALALDLPLLRLLLPADDSATVEVAGQDVPVWHYVAWAVGEEPLPSQDEAAYAEAAEPLRAREAIRRLAEEAAAADRAQRKAGDPDAGRRLDRTFRALRAELEEFRREGITAAGLLPPWLLERYREWNEHLPAWVVVGFQADDGAVAGQWVNKRGERRDATFRPGKGDQ